MLDFHSFSLRLLLMRTHHLVTRKRHINVWISYYLDLRRGWNRQQLEKMVLCEILVNAEFITNILFVVLRLYTLCFFMAYPLRHCLCRLF